MALIDNYSKEELQQIASISRSFSQFCRNLGYKSNSTKTRDTIKDRINKLGIDISHFSMNNYMMPPYFNDFRNATMDLGPTPSAINIEKRTEENTFIKNSDVCQSVLRKKYFQGNYTPYICSICGLKPFWNGKELTLILDHINGENHDDRLENLRWVCPNCNIQLETSNGRNQRVLSKKYYCVDCGKEISKGSTRCSACSCKSRTISLDEMLISREHLKNLIREKSFSELGRLYNVSDNAIRKWCDKYNLPRTKKAIKEYSEEEWSKI